MYRLHYPDTLKMAGVFVHTCASGIGAAYRNSIDELRRRFTQRKFF